ncbi:hypothetical protein [Streptomyces sediminimaris]|uniref:hypothetical protein n=1 Tax=Streptomyces sediminimaris TaxID=3383721 RepID=UPI00399AF55F
MRSATRWVVAAAVAGTATLGAGYAHAIPGVHTSPSRTAPGSGDNSGTSGTSGGLSSPGQAPGTTSQAPQTQSGAS